MIHLNQAASLALIYLYRATYGGVTMINADQVREFQKIINANLEEMESKVHSLTPDYMIDQDELFFLYAVDNKNTGHYVLKDDIESIKKRKDYIMGLPLDVVIASQKENALKSIGLEKVDGEIIKINNKELTRKKD